MTTRAHIFLFVVTLGSVLFTVRLVRTRRLAAKYSMLWLSIGMILVVLAAFPSLLVYVSDRMGVAYAPAAFLLMAIAFLFLLVVHFSWELSRMEERSRRLAEEIALLRNEVVESHAATSPPDASASSADS